MIDVSQAEHKILHREPFAYCAHPHIVRAGAGDWVVVFNRSVRRSVIMHPPHDPLFYNLVTRSGDRGRNWSVPEVAPGYDWNGVECAGLTALPGGTLLLHQWRFRWYPLGLARRLASTVELQFPREFVRELVQSAELDTGRQIAADPEFFAPWARGPGETFVHRSEDHGRSWTDTRRLDTTPYSGGYGMRGGIVLSDGEILLPLNDIPDFCRIFIVRSRDDGHSWSAPTLAVFEDGRLHTEPALLRLASGRLLLMTREDQGRIMHASRSDDDGVSWSKPSATGIDGYPPHLLLLPDGRILCTYGMRQPEYGIRAVLSDDGGECWRFDRGLRIRGPLPNRDLGYPSTLLDDDGSLFTVYYCQDSAGITGIESTRWRLPD